MSELTEWIDHVMGHFRWYRRRRRGSWYYIPERGIPPRCVAHRSFMPNKLALRALRSGRRARNICHRISDSGH